MQLFEELEIPRVTFVPSQRFVLPCTRLTSFREQTSELCGFTFLGTHYLGSRPISCFERLEAKMHIGLSSRMLAAMLLRATVL